MGYRGDDGIFHVCILLDHPGTGLPGEAAAYVQRNVVVAGELDGTEHQDPAAVAAISSISSNEIRLMRCASGTIRGSAVKTPVTSV